MFKKIIVLFLPLILLVGCFKDNQVNKDSILVVGTNSGFVPYEFMDAMGEVIGFDIDLAQIIADKMGKKLVVKNMPFDALVISLKQSKIDLIIAGLSITQDKKKEVEMIHYSGDGEKEFPLVFWGEIPEDINSIDDLKDYKNKTVSVQAGNIQEEFLSKFDFLDIKPLAEISDLIMDIKYRKSVACVIETLVVEDLKNKFNELKILNVPLDPQDQDFGHGIAIKKENKKLIEQINNIVLSLKKDGTIKKLEKKWFSNGK